MLSTRTPIRHDRFAGAPSLSTMHSRARPAKTLPPLSDCSIDEAPDRADAPSAGGQLERRTELKPHRRRSIRLPYNSRELGRTNEGMGPSLLRIRPNGLSPVKRLGDFDLLSAQGVQRRPNLAGIVSAAGHQHSPISVLHPRFEHWGQRSNCRLRVVLRRCNRRASFPHLRRTRVGDMSLTVAGLPARRSFGRFGR